MNALTDTGLTDTPLAAAAGAVIKSLRQGVLAALLAGGALIGCDGTESSSATSAGSRDTGIGGSTARMTIAGDYLYAIAGDRVQLFDISAPQAPNPWARVQVAWDIETLFPYGDYLLIGAATGMHIMDNRDPASPQYLAEFTHARARDPVVAHEGYAYVTLKSDGFGGADQLDVIDIRDIENPRLVRTIGMQGPSGLSVGSNDLYVCDDVAGLKIFDLSDREAPTIVDTISDVNCNDVIASAGILYVITDDSLLQYDYTVMPPALLSQVRESTLSEDN